MMHKSDKWALAVLLLIVGGISAWWLTNDEPHTGLEVKIMMGAWAIVLTSAAVVIASHLRDRRVRRLR